MSCSERALRLWSAASIILWIDVPRARGRAARTGIVAELTGRDRRIDAVQVDGAATAVADGIAEER